MHKRQGLDWAAPPCDPSMPAGQLCYYYSISTPLISVIHISPLFQILTQPLIYWLPWTLRLFDLLLFLIGVGSPHITFCYPI
ncbi:uncharacterized protein EI90DRAFT_3028463 [Cantharellus anzutake]|uniref:uncharacterized protein n=1 Tax=Cantharellus anzutake TaxID=1750568 RepID=UPI0019070C6B|nr:uncharacterized protein EI90DRAFT_3028463 [Cantharellus anzutake]KAF8344157.1 hypothetical protein EI90DRAFT_3028463 [Cantharellus anzutake]